jgi:hypothetical protein
MRRTALAGEIGRPFIIVVVVTLTSMFAVSAAMWTLATHISQAPLSDPFVAYADIFPSQHVSISDLEARGFFCVVEVLPTPADLFETCQLDLPNGAISAINLSLWDSVVVTLTFSLGGGAATVGDLALMLGNPEIQVSGRRVNLNWREPHIAGWAWPEDGQFTYFEPVRQVSFGR